MPIWWLPPTTCSESPDSARPPHEARLHHTTALASASENRRTQRLNPALLSLRWRSHRLIKPLPQRPARAQGLSRGDNLGVSKTLIRACLVHLIRYSMG